MIGFCKFFHFVTVQKLMIAKEYKFTSLENTKAKAKANAIVSGSRAETKCITIVNVYS
jgi:hypothetical protein